MRLLFTISLVLLCFSSAGQKNKEAEIDSLNDLCYELFDKNPAKSLELARKTYRMSEKANYPMGKAGALTYMARCYYVNYSDYDTALVLFNRAVRIDSLDGRMDDVIVDYAGISSMYRTNGDLVNAIKYNYQALQLAEKFNYPIYEYGLLLNQASAYSEMRDSVKSEIKYLRALDLLNSLGDTLEDKQIMLCNMYIALGSLYMNFPGLAGGSESGKVLNYLTQALRIAESEEDIFAESEANSFLCQYYFLKEEYSTALAYGESSVTAVMEMQRPYDESVNRLLVVEVYIKLGRIKKAHEEVDLVMSMAKSNDFHEVQIEALTLLSRIYMLEGDIDNAYWTLEARFALRDSILGSEEKAKIRDTEYKYDLLVEQNKSLQLEKEIDAKESSERLLRYSLIGLSILIITILIIVFFFFRLRKAKRKLTETEFKQKEIQNQLEISMLEVALLSAQMKPHFTFNVLNSIQYLIVSNQSDKAIKYLSEFAKFLRSILEHSNQPIISLEDELSIVRSYLSLEKLRFKEKLTFAYDVDSDIELSKHEIPSLCLQPLVENSILHGFNHEGSGHILVRVRKISEQEMEVVVQDNGLSSSSNSENDLDSKKSMGLEITRKRLENLNAGNTIEVFKNHGMDGITVKVRLVNQNL